MVAVHDRVSSTPARSEGDRMTVKLHQPGLRQARSLVRDGKVVRDERDDWSEDAPTPDEENAFIEEHGWAEYGHWHLGVDDDEDRETKGALQVPVRRLQEGAPLRRDLAREPCRPVRPRRDPRRGEEAPRAHRRGLSGCRGAAWRRAWHARIASTSRRSIMHDATAATPGHARPEASAPPTAAVADAALRLGVDARLAPVALRALLPCAPLAGRARPVTHLGSVDVLLETIDDAAPGDVLVIDNGGRLDEACIGDLMVLEAERAGLAAMVVWGLHRDTAQLREIGLPRVQPRRVPVRSAARAARRSAHAHRLPRRDRRDRGRPRVRRR